MGCFLSNSTFGILIAFDKRIKIFSMKLSRWIPFVVAVFMIMSFNTIQNPSKKIQKEVKNVFEMESFSYSSLEISDATKAKLPSRISDENFFIVKQGANLIGYVYIDKAPSKTAEFDYLVIFDKNLSIARTKVLVYREEYGGEIGSRRWLKQFIGKKTNDNLNDVAAISGATISVRSMKIAVSNIMKSLDYLNKNKLL